MSTSVHFGDLTPYLTYEGELKSWEGGVEVGYKVEQIKLPMVLQAGTVGVKMTFGCIAGAIFLFVTRLYLIIFSYSLV
jgi:hypothetical protein